MGFMHISLAPNRELYDRVQQQVDIAALQADGLLLHSASELPDGQVRIVDLWADAEALEKGRTRMMATFEGLGVGPMVHAGPQPEVSETFDLVR